MTYNEVSIYTVNNDGEVIFYSEKNKKCLSNKNYLLENCQLGNNISSKYAFHIYYKHFNGQSINKIAGTLKDMDSGTNVTQFSSFMSNLYITNTEKNLVYYPEINVDDKSFSIYLPYGTYDFHFDSYKCKYYKDPEFTPITIDSCNKTLVLGVKSYQTNSVPVIIKYAEANNGIKDSELFYFQVQRILDPSFVWVEIKEPKFYLFGYYNNEIVKYAQSFLGSTSEFEIDCLYRSYEITIYVENEALIDKMPINVNKILPY